MWMKATCDWENQRPYQACVGVCQKGSGKSGKEISRTACTKQAGGFKTVFADEIFLYISWNRKTCFISLYS